MSALITHTFNWWLEFVQTNYDLAITSKLHLQNARIAKLQGLMQEFCDRRDRGEVRSTYTYNKFKEALKEAK